MAFRVDVVCVVDGGSAVADASQAYVIVACGDRLGYHYRAIFAGLLINAYRGDATPIVIYTDRPELFRNYPFEIVPIPRPIVTLVRRAPPGSVSTADVSVTETVPPL